MPRAALALSLPALLAALVSGTPTASGGAVASDPPFGQLSTFRCKSPGSPPLTLPKTIGKPGGQVPAPHGPRRHLVAIPAGALQSAVPISLRAAAGDIVGVVAGPSGTKFTTPATLKIHWKGCSGITAGNAFIVQVDPKSHVPIANVRGPSVVRGDTVTAQIDHFSEYALATGTGVTTDGAKRPKHRP